MSRRPEPRTIRRALAAPAAVLAAVALTAGCSSSKGSSTGGASTGAGGGSSANAVDVKGFAFSPGTINVSVGTKVTWTFDDSAAHTVKADDGSFSSAALNGGKTFSFTFAKAGTYTYICSIHPFMKGQVVVK